MILKLLTNKNYLVFYRRYDIKFSAVPIACDADILKGKGDKATMSVLVKSLPITSAEYRSVQLESRPWEFDPMALFEHNVEILVAKGLATPEQAAPFRAVVPKEGLSLWVPPRPKELTYQHLLKLAVVDGKSFRMFLSPSRMKDYEIVPSGAYLMVGVRDGGEVREVSGTASLEKIEADGRFPYIAYEGIIHAIVFPEVFETHNMDLLGTRYDGPANNVFIDGRNSKPGLDAGRMEGRDPFFGAASCRSRLPLNHQEVKF